ncbi:hypothetical protein F5146DRAFT_1065981 [Armillaria mellea]|nr:hypothetical protein F5146DRAFT_1065981 [Armillaria mellea]
MVQVMYAIRLWKVRQYFHLSRVIPWFLALITACNVGTGIYLVYGAYSISNFSDVPAVKNEMIAAFSMSTAVDFIISITMCYHLNRSKAASIFPNTISMLVALMRLILISGLVTSVCSTTTLIAYLMGPNTLIFLAIDLTKSKLYINSLLAMCVPSTVIREL